MAISAIGSDLGQCLARSNAICESHRYPAPRTLGPGGSIVNQHHLRQVLIEYLRHYTTRLHRGISQLAPAQAHMRPPERSVPPNTQYAENKSSANSRTSTRSMPDTSGCLEKNQITALIANSSPTGFRGLFRSADRV